MKEFIIYKEKDVNVSQIRELEIIKQLAEAKQAFISQKNALEAIQMEISQFEQDQRNLLIKQEKQIKELKKFKLEKSWYVMAGSRVGRLLKNVFWLYHSTKCNIRRFLKI